MTGDRFTPGGLLELVLEVANLERSVHFYRDSLGMEEVVRWGVPRPGVWLKMGENQALGLWPPESGGPGVGLHGGRGGAHVHFAVHVEPGSLDTWLAKLLAAGLEVEGPIAFGPRNRSIYLDDPDGNVVELAEWASDWGGSPVRLRAE